VSGDDEIVFYFSFRSPYAWLAYHRLERALGDLPVTVRRVPLPPPEAFPNDPAAIPAKLRYLRADIERMAAAHGLPVRWPPTIDTAWARPHAAYLHAADQGAGDRFALAAYAARFSEGRDLGSDDTLRRVAAAADVDPAVALRAADDPALHERVTLGLFIAAGEGVFGVPTFLYRGRCFWGNDRLEWLRRAVLEDLGRPVPDLAAEPLAIPCG
jgi:2-hydroxychromene-2-carboxylate isomerase